VKRITIVTGHYGSGKSEFSVNLALRKAETGVPFALVDVDIVNPYFRSRERRSLLEDHGIRVIANSFARDVGVDIPAVSAEVYTPFQDPHMRAVVDAGGDPVGARLLGSFRRFIDPDEVEVLCVLNASRPETRDAAHAIELIHGIEEASGLAVTGLVNNTHMLEHTTPSDVSHGNDLCMEISRELGTPISYVSLLSTLVNDVPEGIQGEVLPITLYLREAWMFT